jgi:hypothetical protein
MPRTMLTAAILPPFKRRLSKKETARLASGFAAKTKQGAGPDPDGVTKDVAGKMIHATAENIAKRRK